MDRARRLDSRRGQQALQPAKAGNPERIPADADADASQSRTRRARQSDGDSEHPAARRLRVDRPWLLIADACQRTVAMGTRERRGDSRCPSALRCRAGQGAGRLGASFRSPRACRRAVLVLRAGKEGQSLDTLGTNGVSILLKPLTTDIEALKILDERLRWLSAWTIHHANHVRENTDGLKVGGHQASCSSMTAIMAALYFHALGPNDRVAVKPHAGTVLHAIHYLLGSQSLEALENFRGFGG